MLKNMKIGLRLGIAFGIILVLMIISLFVGVSGLNSVGKEFDDLINDKFPKTVWANNIIDANNLAARVTRNIFISNDPTFIKEQYQRLDEIAQSVNENYAKLQETIKSDKGKALIKKIDDVRNNQYYPARDKFFKFLNSGNKEQAEIIMFGDLQVAQDNYIGACAELIEYQNQLVNKAGENTHEANATSMTLLYILGAVAVILGILIAILITRSIVRPVSQAGEAANKIAQGDLKVDLHTDAKDETGMLLNSMKTMVGNVQNILDETDTLIKSAQDGRLDARAAADKYKGSWHALAGGVNNLVDAFVGPINVTAEYVDRISKGDIPPKITDEYKGDFNEIKNNLNAAIDVMNGLLKEVNDLTQSTLEGKLDARADASKFVGGWGQLVQGVNDLNDAFVGPINVTAEYVDRISKGDIPPKIVDEYKGDFNEIKNNLNAAIDVMNGLLSSTNELIVATRNGQLDKRADADQFVGGWGELVSGVNDLVDAFVGPINVTAEYVDRISKGDIPPKITDEYKGDFNEIKNNLNTAIDVMNGLLSTTNELIVATRNGQLDKRADADQFVGGWGELVSGVNDLVDAFVSPINVTAEYVDRISKGDLPPKITDEYKGDFNEIKNNLNTAIDAISNLVQDANDLATNAIYGRLRVRSDENRHGGDFRKIVQGVNLTLDTIVGLLDTIPLPLMSIDNDFKIQFMNESGAKLNNKSPNKLEGSKCYDHFKTSQCNTGDCACHIAMQSNQTKTQQTDAHPGNLDLEIEYTGSPIKNQQGDIVGAFEIVVDQTEVKEKIRVAEKIATYQNKETDKLVNALEILAKGDLQVHIDYEQPDEDTKQAYDTLMRILTAVRVFKDAVIELGNDTIMLAESASNGKLATRADVSKHSGDYRKIVEGFNNTLDAVINPISEAGEVLSIMATGDLTARMVGNYKGELAKFKKDLNSLGASLSNLIGQVNQTVHTTASSAMEISSTAESLAAASQEQSAQADEVASAVEEMSRTITENAMAANKTAEVAQNNGKVAEDGGHVVEQTVTKMRDIANVVRNSAENIEKLGDSSKQIGEIISVIDDIADQTNLLALNAAIEAARAGEQGRGFAVVADEVRKLAERTTEATKQIANMIKGIQSETEQAVVAMNRGNEEVSSGIDLADKAGTSLEEILGSTKELIDMINQIAAASEEQSATSEEISKNVVSISKVTADSTRRIEDVANTSDELAKLTEHLNELMSQFKVEDDGHGMEEEKNMRSIGHNDHRSLPPVEEEEEMDFENDEPYDDVE